MHGFLWLTRSSRLPRPASPGSTIEVETVHPQGFTRRGLEAMENCTAESIEPITSLET